MCMKMMEMIALFIIVTTLLIYIPSLLNMSILQIVLIKNGANENEKRLSIDFSQ